ncbi:MAG: nucleotidyltransferase family protein [Lachnospirales bacterium]
MLFGSRAKGNYTEKSDIDIAIYGGDFDSFYWDIKEKTSSLLMFDIVDLNTTISDELKNEIKNGGITLYEKI